MTATEELRHLLSKRGVEYEAPNDIITMWAGGVCSWIAIEDKDGLAVAVNRNYLTPEQAIAVTLGMGVNCSKAEHDAGGCLGFQSGDDDEPVEQCKACHRYTSWEVEL